MINGSVWTPDLVRTLYGLYREVEEAPYHGWRKLLSQRLGVRETQLIARLARDCRAGKLRRIGPNAGVVAKKPRRRRAVKKASPALVPTPMPAPEPPAAPAPLRTCQFPLWPNHVRPPRPPCFCGAEVSQGPWCAQHRKQVFAGRRMLEAA